jgi:hypothetical protein
MAPLIGRSTASVRIYERHPEDTPDDVLALLPELEKEQGGSASPLQARVSFSAEPDRQRWHACLDAIFDSRNEKAIHAVQSNLLVFRDYVSGLSPKLVPAGNPKNSRKPHPKVG